VPFSVRLKSFYYKQIKLFHLLPPLLQRLAFRLPLS
jgi:hypothetical protein